MTHARHAKATADPADIRAGRVRDAHAKLYDSVVRRYGHQYVNDFVADCQRECLETLEEAEREREKLEDELRRQHG